MKRDYEITIILDIAIITMFTEARNKKEAWATANRRYKLIRAGNFEYGNHCITRVKK